MNRKARKFLASLRHKLKADAGDCLEAAISIVSDVTVPNAYTFAGGLVAQHSVLNDGKATILHRRLYGCVCFFYVMNS
jgi:hypothetical protein